MPLPKGKTVKKAIRKPEPKKEEVPEKRGRGNPKGRVAEFDKDVVHLISQQLYILALCEEGRKLPHEMSETPKKFDMYCEPYKSRVRSILRVLIQLGILSKDDLKVPEGVPVRAEDTGTDGIPRWIKEYMKAIPDDSEE